MAWITLALGLNCNLSDLIMIPITWGVIDHHQGMNKRFDHMKVFIKRLQPFPSLHTVRKDLKLEEIQLDNSAAQGQASAFYSVTSSGGRPPQ
jgi:hypothetical protein